MVLSVNFYGFVGGSAIPTLRPFLLLFWNKNVLKNSKRLLPSKIRFYAFSVKRKENDLERKLCFWKISLQSTLWTVMFLLLKLLLLTKQLMLFKWSIFLVICKHVHKLIQRLFKLKISRLFKKKLWTKHLNQKNALPFWK